MHNGFLNVDGEKMSKSLGNFFTVRDLLDRGMPGEVIRFVLLSTHYRQPMDWTEAKVDEAHGLRSGRWLRDVSGRSSSRSKTGPRRGRRGACRRPEHARWRNALHDAFEMSRQQRDVGARSGSSGVACTSGFSRTASAQSVSWNRSSSAFAECQAGPTRATATIVDALLDEAG